MSEQNQPARFAVRMINIEFYPLLGGAQMHTLRLSSYLRAHGVDVEVITRHHPGLPTREIVEGVPVYRAPILHPSKAGASLSFLFFALRLLAAQRGRVQIIHSHEMLSPMTIGLMSRALYGTKLVINPHRGGYLGDVWKLKQRRKVTGSLRMAWARSQADAFVAISKEIYAELAGAGIAEEKIHLIPCALDTGHYRPASPDARRELRARFGLDDALTACYTGRLVEEKGLDVLIHAWQALVQQHPNTRLLIVGDGSQRQKLEAQVAGAGLGQLVRFTGQVADTTPYLQACDLYVQPSFTEGLPIGVLEAMACGLPVLATEVGGVSDIMTDRQNGRITRPHDAAALSGPVGEMISNPADRARFGAQAREDVIRYCAIEKVGQQHLDLYASLLKKEPSSASQPGDRQ